MNRDLISITVIIISFLIVGILFFIAVSLKGDAKECLENPLVFGVKQAESTYPDSSFGCRCTLNQGINTKSIIVTSEGISDLETLLIPPN